MMKKWIWSLWALMTLVLTGYYGYTLVYAEDKSALLIGEATHGHHQIELACTACHAEPFGGKTVLQEACLTCHQEELKEAQDSHPLKKFTDPRNADTLAILDARFCISCHKEHQNEQTQTMGLTLPEDYCFHCHQDIGEERDTHKDLAFDSCASSGCHNYHDNRALYEKFLVDNAGGDWLQVVRRIDRANNARLQAPRDELHAGVAPLPPQSKPEILADWQHSAHAEAGVGCLSCHQSEAGSDWIERPTLESCAGCHVEEAKGFQAGKHGMRLAQDLTAMSPGKGRLTFTDDSSHQSLTCASCHDPHTADRRLAAVEACLGCHADDHSRAFEASPHGQLWQAVQDERLPVEESVSCATCHLPRLKEGEGENALIRVQHNQNDNLRPNEKMIRPVCMQCHSLEFSIDALADPVLIHNNFNGSPSVHVPSVDWALSRE